MSLSGARSQFEITSVLLLACVGLSGCRATTNRLARLPGMGWMASENDSSLIASYDKSDLPPPSAVTEPYRPDHPASGPRGIDGSVASFDRPYPSTGYPATSGGYQTGPYDAGGPQRAASGETSKGAANGAPGYERSRYYDQFTESGSSSSPYQAGTYGRDESASRYDASRYGATGSYPASADASGADWSQGERTSRSTAPAGQYSRYSQMAQDTGNRFQSRYDEAVAEAGSRYSEAVDGVGRAISASGEAVRQTADEASRSLTDTASHLRSDVEGRANDALGQAHDRLVEGRRALDDNAYGAADALRNQIDSVQRAVDGAADATRDAVSSAEEAYRTAAAQRQSGPAPGAWRPGSTSDYRR